MRVTRLSECQANSLEKNESVELVDEQWDELITVTKRNETIRVVCSSLENVSLL